MSSPLDDVLTPLLAQLDTQLADVDAALAASTVELPTPQGQQPVHTVYAPADVGDDATAELWGRRALGLLARHAPDTAALAAATGLEVDDDDRERLLELLRTRPIADLRLDLEDGYGLPGETPGRRSDVEEDSHADAAGAALARIAGRRVRGQVAPGIAGVRIRSFEPSTRRRAVRTLARVVAAVVATAERGADAPEAELGALPEHLLLTLAKVSDPAQVSALADVLDALEDAHGLPRGWVCVEVQVEVPALVVSPDGRAAVARCREAARGRMTGLHYGTYDFSAACGVPPAHQSLEHPLADHAKAVLQLAAAGTGVAVSDGSTNVLPTGGADGSDAAQVHAAWTLHARLVTRALERGLAQGWDLHPGHLVTRHLANLVHAKAGLPDAERRLAAWVAATAARAAAGDDAAAGVADEPATAQAMARLLVRADVVGAQELSTSAQRVGMDVAALQALARRRVG
ncbi:hypothetical protein SAMN06264364_11662 [Quadrisphaera granulorum]|uniref:HpcH/HpaI aldolase/citrate lyase family protein n=1 Tax=Quadrisphaera granulorum TaxID=317664 RepID=A0A316A4T3_9ACTN|nr:aldolase [Quadrisphaera granulorum]PWJ52926.1 hypothetical protein BXY45_11662 [Quadrisphaera granulorum]SZE97308.1 hypothetical protein SAMN06264364_11662 [Quadrisphaera granulorum]